MKKTIALLGSILLSSSLMLSIHAAETQNIETSNETEMQEGKIFGALSGNSLKQMRVTIPIKLELTLAPVITIEGTKAPDTANRVYNGNYKIKVDANSEVGVQLDKVNLKGLSDWSLDTVKNVENLVVDKSDPNSFKKAKTVAIVFAGKELVEGDTLFEPDEFTVPISAEKSLGFVGVAGKVWIDKDLKASKDEAFRITYTISQK